MKPYGLHGCSCHPFENWDECNMMHKQTFAIGEKVKQRHTGKEGEIFEIYTGVEKGYVIVKYGKLPHDRVLEHVANLTRIINQ